jgi:hypothetical protein
MIGREEQSDDLEFDPTLCTKLNTHPTAEMLLWLITMRQYILVCSCYSRWIHNVSSQIVQPPPQWYTDHFTPNHYIVKSPGEASIIQGQSNNIPRNLSSSSQEKASRAYHSHPFVNSQAFPLRVSHAGSSLSTHSILQLSPGSSALITTQRHPVFEDPP